MDPTSGFVCFGRDIARHFTHFFPQDFPEIETEILLIRAGYQITTVPVEMKARQRGISSINFVHSIVYVLAVSIAFFISFIRENPYHK